LDPGRSAYPHHQGDVRPVDVGVQETNLRAGGSERDGEVHGDRGLAHSTLPTRDGDDVLYTLQHLSLVVGPRRHHVGGDFHAQLLDAAEPAYRLLRSLLDSRPQRAGGCREVQGEGYNTVLDPDVFHHVQGDDVLPELWVGDGRENFEDILF